MQKTIIITGANSGLGFEATKQIAAAAPEDQIVMAVRNMEKGEAARLEILKDVPNAKLVCLPLDSSSLAKVRAFVDDFRRLDVKLTGLICNAGIAGINVESTSDGYNNIFETNYLGHFLLTQLLIPFMTSHSRIINVSSDRHDAPKDLTWPGVEKVAYCGKDALVDRRSYSYSKLCQIFSTYALSRQFASKNLDIQVNAVNLGLMIETGLSKDKSRFSPERLAQFVDILSTAKESGKMLTDLMTKPQFADTIATYFDRRSDNPIPSSALPYNEGVQDDLLQFSMKATGLNK